LDVHITLLEKTRGLTTEKSKNDPIRLMHQTVLQSVCQSTWETSWK